MEFIFVIFIPFSLSWWSFLLYTFLRDTLRDSGLFDDATHWVGAKLREFCIILGKRRLTLVQRRDYMLRNCETFLSRYHISEVNIWTEVYASLLIVIILLYDTFLLVSLEFGGSFSLGESDLICKAARWEECHHVRWLVISGFVVLLAFELLGYFITVFILNSRAAHLMLNLYSNSHAFGLDPAKLIEDKLAEPLRRSSLQWRLNMVWMIVSLSFTLAGAFRYVTRFHTIVDACAVKNPKIRAEHLEQEGG